MLFFLINANDFTTFYTKGAKDSFWLKKESIFLYSTPPFTYFLKRLCIHLLFEKFGNSTQNLSLDL